MNCKKKYMAFHCRETSKVEKKDMERYSQEENLFRMAVATWICIIVFPMCDQWPGVP